MLLFLYYCFFYGYVASVDQVITTDVVQSPFHMYPTAPTCGCDHDRCNRDGYLEECVSGSKYCAKGNTCYVRANNECYWGDALLCDYNKAGLITGAGAGWDSYCQSISSLSLNHVLDVAFMRELCGLPELPPAVKKVAMKKVKFKQTVKGITKEQCAGVKGAIRKGTAKQLKIAEEGVTVKEEGAGVCVDGSRRRLATGSQSFAVEAEVESSNVEEAKKTVASDNFQNAIVSEASQGGVKDLKTEKVEANKIEVDEVEDGKDGVFAFGTFVFGVFALLL